MKYEMRGFSRRRAIVALFATLLCGFVNRSASAQIDPLPSWNDGTAKKSITDFVARVTTQGDADFVPIEQRIATFDNDGTLWCEQPVYFQLAFAFDRVRAMAPQHPEWKTTQPFKALLDQNMQAFAAFRQKGLLQIVAATHTGMTTDEFSNAVLGWTVGARHPRFNRPYTELVYQPMLELLAYLRANGFKTFIVSGGGIEFMRPWVEKIYGIPPEQVVGSSGIVKFQIGASGKPEWTAAGPGARFAGIVHHTDALREYAYDRQSKIGKLDKAWDEAEQRNWTIVDMNRDWKTVFPEASPR